MGIQLWAEHGCLLLCGLRCSPYGMLTALLRILSRTTPYSGAILHIYSIKLQAILQLTDMSVVCIVCTLSFCHPLHKPDLPP